jgi:hypothetical protein
MWISGMSMQWQWTTAVSLLLRPAATPCMLVRCGWTAGPERSSQCPSLLPAGSWLAPGGRLS